MPDAERDRTIAEPRIVAFLLSPYEIAAGRRQHDEPHAQAILDRCISLGLPHATAPGGQRLFDPAEVVNFIKYAHFAWAEPIWMQRGVGMLRRLMGEAVPGTPAGEPPDLAVLRPNRYAVTITRRFHLTGRKPGDRLRLRLPLPIADATLADPTIEVLPPPGLAIHTRIEPARLEVVLAVPDDLHITIAVRTEFQALPRSALPPPPLDPSEAVLYTRPSEGLVKVNARVQALANRLAGPETDQWTILRHFWDHLFDDLDLGFIHYDRLDPHNPLDWTLDHRRYNCQTGAALLVALCRARGIPARMVSGYTLNPVLPTSHSWCEIWFESQGWLPFDLYSMDLCGGDRDSLWRHHYFGRLDHRLVTERPPLLFCGTGAVRLPAAWHMVSATTDQGAVTEFEDRDSGRPIYSETVSVQLRE